LVTGGEFGLLRGLVSPGAEVAAGFHRASSESFYVLDGRFQVFNGDRWSDVNGGDLVCVPAGGVHGLTVVGDWPVAVLTVFAPGVARERFVSELLESAGRAHSSARRVDRVLPPP
jgi:mannose-6-phosphate isomerase-like protein (cupin superfamily)